MLQLSPITANSGQLRSLCILTPHTSLVRAFLHSIDITFTYHTFLCRCRMILVLFLYIEGWPYGHLLADAKKAGAAAADAPEGAVGGDSEPKSDPSSRGYVVYRETSMLMEALDTGEDDAQLMS